MKYRLWDLEVLLLLGCASTAAAQLPPARPLFPRDPQECQKFAADLDRYAADISKQHEVCLDQHKQDRPSEQHDSNICSRSTCQYLHDILFSDLTGYVRDQRKQIDLCYKEVKEKQEEEQRETARKEEEERARQKRDMEAKDREAARQSQAHKQGSAQQTRTVHDGARKDDTSPRIASTTTAGSAAPPGSVSAITKGDGYSAKQEQLAKQKTQEARSELKEPFERAQKEAAALGIRDPGVVDPFSDSKISKNSTSRASDLADPFAGRSDAKADRANGSGSEEASETATEVVKEGFDMLKDAVERGKVQAKGQLSSAAYRRYAKGADDAVSISSGVTHTITLLQDLALVKNIYEADVPEARKREEARLGYQVAKDAGSYAFSRDAVKQGVQNVLVRTFPDSIAPYVIQYGPAALTAGSVTFDSSEAAAPGLLHNEKWEAMSSKEKEHVLSTWWKYYEDDRRSGRADSFPVDDLRALIDQTDSLYRANLQKQ